MRKITSESVEAFRNGRKYKSGNTIVMVSYSGTMVSFLLHGNNIASYNKQTNMLALSDCGWATVTTKERLNGILKAFNLPYSINQVDFEWYIGGKIWRGAVTINLLTKEIESN